MWAFIIFPSVWTCGKPFSFRSHPNARDSYPSKLQLNCKPLIWHQSVNQESQPGTHLFPPENQLSLFIFYRGFFSCFSLYAILFNFIQVTDEVEKYLITTSDSDDIYKGTWAKFRACTFWVVLRTRSTASCYRGGAKSLIFNLDRINWAM